MNTDHTRPFTTNREEPLNDPGNVEMWESMGREFAALPAAEQLPTLERALAEAVTRRDEVAAIVADGVPDGDPRRALLAGLTAEVDAYARRIADLSGPVPDHL